VAITIDDLADAIAEFAADLESALLDAEQASTDPGKLSKALTDAKSAAQHLADRLTAIR